MSGRTLVAGALLLLMATTVAYLPAFQAGFVWDDPMYVTENEALRTLDGLRRIWVERGATIQYYPLTFTTLWVDYQIWGLNPTGYHATNVLLQRINAVLYWLVLRRLALRGAWLAAAVFALHPVQVEAVAWITERKNTLSGLFYLLSTLAYLRFRPFAVGNVAQPPSAVSGQEKGSGTFCAKHPKGLSGKRFLTPFPDRQKRWHWYVLALGAFLAALLSKTVTCSLPAAILLLTWWKRDRLSWRDVLPLLPFFVFGLGLALVTIAVEAQHVGAQGPEWAFSFADRVLIAGRALWFYVGKLLWPVNLAFIYHRWEIDDRVWWQYAYPAAALAALLGLWWARRRIGKGALVAALFFAGTLLPALGFVNVYPMRYSFVADHFQYLASLGIIALVIGTAGAALRRVGPAGRTVAAGLRAGRSGGRAAPVLGAAALLVLGTGAHQRSLIYHDMETLWRDTIAKSPSSPMVNNNLGVELDQQGRSAEAIPYLETALRLRPDDINYQNNLANAYGHARRFEDALSLYAAALRQDPNSAKTHYNLGLTYSQLGRDDEAIRHLTRALQIHPQGESARPYLAAALLRRVDTLLHEGKPRQAVDSLTRAVPFLPDSVRVRMMLAHALGASGRSEEAVVHYRECLKRQPDLPEALNALAWFLATAPDPVARASRPSTDPVARASRPWAEAVALAERACRLTEYRDPSVLDTLAAALADVGQFDRAVEVARSARDLAQQLGAHSLVDSINQRIQLYAARTPYRERPSPGSTTAPAVAPPASTRAASRPSGR